jgi:SPP1 family predicted phage head-tail adaptor
MAISGDLRHKITLKAPVTSKNDEGAIEVTYPTNNIETFAQVRRVSQSRVNEAVSNALLYTKEFIIRWSSGREAITKDWLLVYNGENYIISEIVRVNELQQWISIKASTKING